MSINNDILDRIDKIILQNIKIHKITGASISVIDNEAMIYSKGFGFADKAN
jgi:CubicO group peptidase (beta-lactamase class C family)